MSNSEPETNENIYRSVDELEVAVRTYASLQNADIVYIGELIQRTEAELIALKFDKRSIKELKEICAEMGLTLGTKIPDWPGREEAARRGVRSS
jgi:DNA-directed RNA polymerase subunit alpha